MNNVLEVVVQISKKTLLEVFPLDFKTGTQYNPSLLDDLNDTAQFRVTLNSICVRDSDGKIASYSVAYCTSKGGKIVDFYHCWITHIEIFNTLLESITDLGKISSSIS